MIKIVALTRQARRDLRSAPRHVATKLGISRSHLCDIEKERKSVGPARGARFAKTLGYPPESFVALALQAQVREAGLKLNVKVEAA